MRKSGVLMHITSLPGKYGVGTMGKNAYQFVDFLKKSGQSYWQILPLTPTGYGDSPYQSYSTFAGNHYLIDLETLVEEGLLCPEELDSIQWSYREDKVDFGLLYNNRLKVLRKAFQRHGETEEFAKFRADNDSWLPQFASYMVLKERFAYKPWYQWPEGMVRWSAQALEHALEYAGYEGFHFYCFASFIYYICVIFFIRIECFACINSTLFYVDTF